MTAIAKKVRGHSRHDQVAIAVDKIRINQELRDFITERDMPAHLDMVLTEAFPGDLK
ncbi:hypothetical protein ACNT8L_05835 [Brucella intermedia]|uniref:hypothetical protein n=1 Tax=Brucella intermedia TaxID=94625 RepID=UPI003AB716CD